MSKALQAKFLKVLEGGAFERLGGTVTQKVDARIICATNRDLQKEAAAGNFRQDLYFRLNVFPIHIPPLRTRKAHIPQLCRYLAASISKRTGKDAGDIHEAVTKALASYDWPGNVRELQNILERSIIMSKREVVAPAKAEPSESKDTFNLMEIERSSIANALKHTGGNRKEAA
jgi:transcriptional regulator with PAS, ATPase and Fis domain